MSIHIATIDDAPFMFEWRKDTDPEAGTDYTQEQHLGWMAQMLLDEKRVMLIGSMHDRPVGVMTLRDDNNALDVTIAMVSGERGKGLGTRMLVLASGTMQEYDLSAEIWRKNMASVKLFRHAGFEPDKARQSNGVTYWSRPAKK
ncbi:MAG: GNAT family N-acetyltransferase [Alphaproteobacteria bacterium]|nr:GNAT family N-acetyltransferase [Alphaproteobacteria bacterium]